MKQPSIYLGSKNAERFPRATVLLHFVVTLRSKQDVYLFQLQRKGGVTKKDNQLISAATDIVWFDSFGVAFSTSNRIRLTEKLQYCFLLFFIS